ncbi:MAG TPA: hypothetical protein VKU37_03650 [Verrucomicrobiae bacterium]|nr:hypothetical protein [Verrucomicrobiae bacterium]
MPTRRQFLINCSTLTLAAGFVPAAFFSKSVRADGLSRNRIGFDVFRDNTGSIFTVHAETAAATRLKLMVAERYQAADPGAHIAPDARNENFSVLFRRTAGPMLPQNTYVFEHSDLGRFPLFIVPVRVGQDPGHDCYEAVFNRLPC